MTSLDNAFPAGAADPTAGVYYALDPFGQPPKESAPFYDEIAFSFPGVDGIALKRLGFRGRLLHVDLIVFGTKGTIETAYTTLMTSLTQLARYTITMPGATARQGYKLLPGGAHQASWFNITSSIGVHVPCDFKQYSTTN